MLLNAFRPIFHFWEFENLHSFLIPLIFLVALAIQFFLFFLFRQLKRPWLPIAVCGGLLLVGDIAVVIIVQQLERAAIGIALVGLILETYLLTAALGLAAGLLISYIVKKKSA